MADSAEWPSASDAGLTEAPEGFNDLVIPRLPVREMGEPLRSLFRYLLNMRKDMNWNRGLNADMVDGKHASNFLQGYEDKGGETSLVAGINDLFQLCVKTLEAGTNITFTDSDGKIVIDAAGGGETNPDLISEAEIDAGTETAERVISAARLAYAIAQHGFDGAYSSLTGKPTLGTIAATDLLDEDDFASDSAVNAASQQSTKAFILSMLASSVHLEGTYNAATNTPDLDTSPSGITKGAQYVVSAAGTFFTEPLEVGDTIFALQDNPTALAHWAIVQANLTAASIKTLYESNSNTNAYTDAEKSAVATIANLALKSLTLSAGAGLTGGGTLASDRSFAINYDSTTMQINGSNEIAVKDSTFASFFHSHHEVLELNAPVAVGVTWDQSAVVVDDDNMTAGAYTLTMAPVDGVANSGKEVMFYVKGANGKTVSVEMDSGDTLKSGGIEFVKWESSTDDTMVIVKALAGTKAHSCCYDGGSFSLGEE
jgi:hypothetical protein